MAEEAKFRHFVRVANVDLLGEKQIRWALTTIKGVGIDLADALCMVTDIPKMNKTGYLSDVQIEALNRATNNPLKAGIPSWMLNHRREFETGENKHYLTGTLTFVHENDIKRLKKIRSYRGIRHTKGLPVRGQRTRSNFRRSKGKVVGVVKKKIVSPPAGPEKKKEAKK